jgi:hypothetical protein
MGLKSGDTCEALRGATHLAILYNLEEFTALYSLQELSHT